MTTYFPAGGQNYTLNASITSTQTTITLASFTEPVTGTALTMANMNTAIAYMTIQPKTANSEFISFTGVTQNGDGTATLTGVTRGLGKIYPFTTSSDYKLPHSGGSICILSNMPQVFEKYISLTNDVTITGVKTFTTADRPKLTTDTDTVTDEDLITYGQLARTAISGGVPATTSTLGIVKMSTAPVSALSPIAVGDNDARVPTTGENDALVGNNTDIAVGSGNKYVTQTGLIHSAEVFAVDGSGSSTAYTATLSPVPTSLTNGMVVRVKIGLANTTTTPTLNVNSLGAKTIVKGVNTALVASDIGAGMYCTFIYDSTNTVWVLQSPISTAVTPSFYGVFKNGNTTKQCTDASTTQTIAHGVGYTPKRVNIYAVFQTTASTTAIPYAYTVYNGTTQTSFSYASYNSNANEFNTDFRIAANTGESGYQTGVVTVDSTNISIAWTKTGTISTSRIYSIIWQAEA